MSFEALKKWNETHRNPNEIIEVTVITKGKSFKGIITLKEITKEEWIIPYITNLSRKDIQEINFKATNKIKGETKWLNHK